MRELLTSARDPLDGLARALLQDETIDREELSRLLGPRPEAEGAGPGRGGDGRRALAAEAGAEAGPATPEAWPA